MKITPHHHPGIRNETRHPTKNSGEASFQTQFKQALEASVGKPASSAPVAATRSAPPALFSLGPSSDAETAVSRIEDFLGDLTTYQERLGDGRYSLKNLEQDLHRIGDPYRHLEALSRALPSDDDLQALMREGLAAARIEIERFWRGDYC